MSWSGASGRRGGPHFSLSRRFHYLDDFAIVGPSGSDDYLRYLHILKRVCRDLGVPLAPEKQEGAVYQHNFAGYHYCTEKGEHSLPKEKMDHLLHVLSEWES